MSDSPEDRIIRIERMMLMTTMTTGHSMAALSAVAYAIGAMCDPGGKEHMDKIGDECQKQYRAVEIATGRWIDEIYPKEPETRQ